MRARRARNQCFRCDSQFLANHICPNVHLSVMIATEDEGEGHQTKYEEEEGSDKTEMNWECSTMELHIHSTVGITRPSTMKIQYALNGHPLIILIDSGAYRNFISADWVTKLGITVWPTREFGVKLEDGH